MLFNRVKVRLDLVPKVSTACQNLVAWLHDWAVNRAHYSRFHVDIIFLGSELVAMTVLICT